MTNPKIDPPSSNHQELLEITLLEIPTPPDSNPLNRFLQLAVNVNGTIHIADETIYEVSSTTNKQGLVVVSEVGDHKSHLLCDSPDNQSIYDAISELIKYKAARQAEDDAQKVALDFNILYNAPHKIRCQGHPNGSLYYYVESIEGIAMELGKFTTLSELYRNGAGNE